MKVAAYRSQIDCLRDAFNSFKSVSDNERQHEAHYLKACLGALANAKCPAAKPNDLERAATMITAVRECLAS